MELIKKPVHYTQEEKSIFDQFYLDEDYNVPEQKDDVRRIIQGSAEIRVEEIRPVENYVRITGKVYFRILYMTASGLRFWRESSLLRRWFMRRVTEMKRSLSGT